METWRILLVTLTAALGFVALGLGGFILAPSHVRYTRPRDRGQQTPVA